MSNSLSRVLPFSLVLILLLTTATGRVCAQSRCASLPVDTAITLHLGGEEKHCYELALNPSEFFQVHVEQHSIDVSLRLLNATGVEVARMKLPRSFEKEFSLTFVAPAAESYQLEVSATDAKASPGEFTIRREPTRSATERDRRRVAVEHVFAEGMTARDTKGQAETAIQKFTEASNAWEELADAPMSEVSKLLVRQQEARALYSAAGKFLDENNPQPNRQALKQFEKAARLAHESGAAELEIGALLGVALAAHNLHNLPLAIDVLKRIYPYFSTPEARQDKSSLLLEIARHAIALGDNETALNHLFLALPIYKELGFQREAAIVTMTIGAVYYNEGDYRSAWKFLNEALPARSILGNKCSEIELVVNLAAASIALDRKADAMKLLTEEIPPLLPQASACETHKAVVWNNLGKAYYHLHDYGLAIDMYNKALAFKGERSIKADTWFNLGEVYFESGRYEKALDAYRQAAAFYSDASTQIKLDLDMLQATKDQSPQQQLESSLRLHQKIGDNSGAAKALNRLCLVYLKLGNQQASVAASQQALSLYAALSDRSGEAIALGNAMQVWSAMGQRRLAIFFGKQSLNKIQELRRATRGIDVSLQQNYLRTFKDNYQQLAQLLIEENLSDQAIQVLTLYRDEEFFDRDKDSDAAAEQVYLSANETVLARRYEAQTNKLRSLQQQIAELKGQGATGAELQKLESEFKEATNAFTDVLRDERELFSRPISYAPADRNLESVNALRGALGVLGRVDKQKVVSLYTLATDDVFYVLLVRPSGVTAFSHPVEARSVGEQVAALLDVLRCPDLDPYIPASKVYDLVFKSVSTTNKQNTLEAELDRYKPELLLWSLDESLEALPPAAFYDARRRQFLVERYQHAITNRFRPELISREPKSWLKGIGFGAARAYPGYGPPLGGVRRSLTTIFNDASRGDEGIIDGPALIDDQFRQSDLENLNGRWPLVHIASHFSSRAGDPDNSALLLGDGKKFTLAEMEKKRGLFAGVELLVLSACKTSVQEANAYGKVIEGLAGLSQRLGANAVIATLWNVSDLAASERDILFYRLYREHQDWPKSEVLRQSQLSLLHGTVRPESDEARAASAEGCSVARGRRFHADSNAPLAHPYYWAPFVLYGSSR